MCTSHPTKKKKKKNTWIHQDTELREYVYVQYNILLIGNALVGRGKKKGKKKGPRVSKSRERQGKRGGGAPFAQQSEAWATESRRRSGTDPAVHQKSRDAVAPTEHSRASWVQGNETGPKDSAETHPHQPPPVVRRGSLHKSGPGSQRLVTKQTRG